ncbi:MAG: hypothetical protein AAFV53_27075 [Myxococcota bacterium]
MERERPGADVGSSKALAILDVRDLSNPLRTIQEVLEAGILPLTIITSQDPDALRQMIGGAWRWHRQQTGGSWVIDITPA